MWFVWIMLGVLLLALAYAGWRYVRWRRARLAARDVDAAGCVYDQAPPATWQRVALPVGPTVALRTTQPDVETTVRMRPLAFEAQPAPWREAMAALGRRMRKRGVSRVVFVHGTFAGRDPLSLVDAFAKLATNSAELKRVAAMLGAMHRRMLSDVGNWTPEYVGLVGAALAMPVHDFRWDSANHHLSRLRAAHALLDDLVASGGRRQLLIGHSHAGQVFALLLQLLAGGGRAAKLQAILVEAGANVAELEAALVRGRKLWLDVVTLGTPPRYGWPPHGRFRVLHIINHRGELPTGGSVAGVLTTKHGDYIQQWGIAGSDLLAGSAPDRALNRALDALLDFGIDPQGWLAHVKHRRRVHDVGTTLLVDYGDEGGSPLKPNCLRTLFGHGCYTTYDNMLPTLRLVADAYYPARSAARSLGRVTQASR